METDDLLKGLSRETSIRRDAQGRWFNQGEPLEHPGLVRAFNSWIEVAEDGRYCLRNQVNWAYITLEGPPFFVRSLTVDRSGQVILAVSDGRAYPLDPSTLRQGSDGALYCDVRTPPLTARFDRNAMMQLEPLLGEDEQGVYLRLGGRPVRPPVVSDPVGRPSVRKRSGLGPGGGQGARKTECARRAGEERTQVGDEPARGRSSDSDRIAPVLAPVLRDGLAVVVSNSNPPLNSHLCSGRRPEPARRCNAGPSYVAGMTHLRKIAPALIVLCLGVPLVLFFAQAVTRAEVGRRQAVLRAVLGDAAYQALRRGEKSKQHYLGDSRQAPDFLLNDRQGRPWRLSDQRGQLVVMNFWSADCAPCLQELPGLARLAREAERRGGVEVVTVNTDADRERVQAVMAPYTGLRVLFDPEKKVVKDTYGTLLYPETWIVDPEGVIRLRVDGARDWSDSLSLDLLELFL